MGWLITLAVLILLGLLALLPVGLIGRYHEDGASLKLILGPVRLRLLPQKGKKVSKKTKKHKEKKDSAKESAAPEKKGGAWKDFVPLVKIGLGFLNDFRRKLRVRRLELELIMAGEDPCDLAVNYGRAQAAIGNLFPLLERYFVIGKRDIQIKCDFDGTETLVIACVDVRITLGRLLVLVMRHGLKAWKAYQNLDNIRKGGASE